MEAPLRSVTTDSTVNISSHHRAYSALPALTTSAFATVDTTNTVELNSSTSGSSSSQSRSSWATTPESDNPPSSTLGPRLRSRRQRLNHLGVLSPDRFIPSSSSFSLYHIESSSANGSQERSSSAQRSRHNSAPGYIGTRVGDADVLSSELSLGHALGIPVGPQPSSLGRVLTFKTQDNPLASGPGRVDDDGLLLIVSESRARVAEDCESQKPKKTQKIMHRVLSFAPFRVLDAPGLRDDFYTNLLSWSSTTNDLAVGLGREVYIWQESTGAVLLPEWIASPVSCVSFAPDGKTLAIGRLDGSITIWCVAARRFRAEYYQGAGLCCISWRPKSDEQGCYEFFAGDEVGEVLQFALRTSNGSTEDVLLENTHKTKAHTQQICGIAFNPEGTQVAIGANDNTCTIWKVGKTGLASKPKFRWDHRAAVKALAFCPWSPNLLATGGGSNDRTIRFWHTTSGSLVHSFNTNAQVTSLIWSRNSKEFVATFGYANPEHPIRMTIYSYPDCQPLMQIPWQEDIRCLYAVASPGGGKICTAASDETVRFYEFWDESIGTRVSDWDCGIFGSDILEFCEGIEKDGSEVIR
ncbi:WD40-repeat-containing domain protein [Lipomyces oligophaga]|uniref:WD40-repeat-containing domain protein n=1 Tax=Lipomyces oligophaga TaxID=45792 RepID=UPI0034CE4A19